MALRGGVLLIVGYGPVTIGTVGAVSRMAIAAFLGRGVGALVMSFECALLAVTTEELDAALDAVRPVEASRVAVAWAVVPEWHATLNAHADYAVTRGALRGVFSGQAQAMAWARCCAAYRLAEIARLALPAAQAP